MNILASRKNQQGVALFISLVMLLILTILGVSAVQTTALQERMSRNSFDSNMAFQAAESAVRDAEQYIETNFNSLIDFDAAGAEDEGLYYANAWDEAPNWEAIDWDVDQECTETARPTGVMLAGTTTGTTSVPNVCVQPKFIIEWVRRVESDEDLLNLDNIGQGTGAGRTQVFRITAMGTGGTESAHVMVQTTYGKKF